MMEVRMAARLIPLAEAIGALREELEKAQAAATGEELQFTVGPIELELSLAVQREAEGSGKIEFKIFGWGGEAGGSGKLGDETGHKVKLVLTPEGSGLFKVSDRK
jgi:Trypsin-co-occurring domain 2